MAVIERPPPRVEAEPELDEAILVGDLHPQVCVGCGWHWPPNLMCPEDEGLHFDHMDGFPCPGCGHLQLYRWRRR